MKILHYLYGMPPHRGGGLIKYAIDLAQEEKKQGHEVCLLTAGPITGRNSSKVRIKKKTYSLPLYVIHNPLPIPYSNGIKDIEWYSSTEGKAAYLRFLKEIQPDVIHVHSLMGIHKSFFDTAKSLDIRMVYTSHDYFGLCPCTLLLKDGKACHDHEWAGCADCCRNAFGTMHLIIDQSPIYQALFANDLFQAFMRSLMKLKAVIIKAAQKKKQVSHAESEKRTDSELPDQAENQSQDLNQTKNHNYMAIKSYYQNIFHKIDYFHYNSNVSKEVFEEWLGPVAGKTVPILNKEVGDYRKIRRYDKYDSLRVGFLGSLAAGKGFDIASRVVKALKKKGYDLNLNIYFDPMTKNSDHLTINPPYTYDQIHDIFDDNDVIIVPSIWKETFGFITVEALSHGVPAIVSEHVGSSLLIKDGKTGRILTGDLAKSLYIELKDLCLHREKLAEWNQNIMEEEYDFSFPHHVERICREIYGHSTMEKKND